MLLEQTEIDKKLEVVGQIADLLVNAQLVPAGSRASRIDGSTHARSGRSSLALHTEDVTASVFSSSLSPSTAAVAPAAATATTCGKRRPAAGKRASQVEPRASALEGFLQRSTSPGDAWPTSHTASRSRHPSQSRGADTVSGQSEAASRYVSAAGTDYCYEAGLQLPRSCGPDVVAALNELGTALRQACTELTAAVDHQLVSFYEHMKKKEMGELSEICAARRLVPAGFDTVSAPIAPASVSLRGRASFFASVGAGSALDDDDDDNDEGGDMLFEGVAEGTTWRAGSRTSKHAAMRREAATPSLDAALPRLPFTQTDGTNGPAAVAGVTRGASSRGDRLTADASRSKRKEQSHSSAAPAAATGQLGRQLASSRHAASTLQAFLYLLLEAALTECEATCGAVYVNEVAGTNSDPAAVTAASASTTERQVKGLASASSPKTVSTQARFLQSVAHINGHGYLPQTVSYATTSTLTTVVQTGVALNLRNSTFSVAKTAPESEASKASAHHATTTPAVPSSSSRYLNVSNCVAVPIKNMGVVVIANKRSSAAEGTDFTAMDEHVAWSVALLCENLLARYRRELLLKFAWSPEAVGLLRSFALLSPVYSGEARRTTRARGDGGGAEGDNDERGGGILSFLTSKETQRPMARGLAIVRTADERTLKAIPAELLPKHGGRKSGAAGVDSVGEEDLYEGAAQYIANLESLWRQSLEQQTSMQGLVERCDREAEAKQERVNALEARVRKLNAKVIRLERHEGDAAANPSASAANVWQASGNRAGSARRAR